MVLSPWARTPVKVDELLRISPTLERCASKVLLTLDVLHSEDRNMDKLLVKNHLRVTYRRFRFDSTAGQHQCG
ncbi:hypothetical protein Vid5_gp24 [Pantoea phage vB_PagS_Vid5]|uniref:Uncharacterized protein n=1 Tax=Pantoea phage vB_PagS_Vid5 TaxID=2099652 RepID=A0A2P1CKP6_9CAUD|nr:hypothetical protein FDJ45_gp024 [Pantoea phage vB_PagS_Vid5]AVJ51779.1 hypothetical protein Vid5_gp24 [Pantoea phage vB_PagS_Vid5]